jgi:hypothetical protein
MPASPKLKWSIALAGTAAALTLATLLANRFGLIHFRGQWMYQSRAQIRFTPVKPPTAAELAHSPIDIMGFKEYVDDQCIIIGSQREINLALQEPTWKTTSKGASDEVVQDFVSKLTVEHDASGLLTITYLDEDAEVSLAAVKATVRAYQKLYAEADPEHTDEVLAVLQTDRTLAQDQLAGIGARLAALTAQPDLAQDLLDSYFKVPDNSSGLFGAHDLVLRYPKPQNPLPPITNELEHPLRDALQRYKGTTPYPRLPELLGDLQTQAAALQKQIDTITMKIDRLTTELSLAKRADFLSEGEKAGQVLAEKQNGTWIKLGPTRP